MRDQPYEHPDVAEERPLDMDAITAHLDRGWDLLERGDTQGAKLSAQHILQLEAESPEGNTLLGAIIAMEGDPNEAMDLFHQAIDADPEYVDAFLHAAEVALGTLNDADLTLQLCDEAKDLVPDDSEEASAIALLSAEAHLASENVDAARRILAKLPSPPSSDPVRTIHMAAILIDVEEPARAIEILTPIVEDPSLSADVHYYLGAAHQVAGDPREALVHHLAADDLDRKASPPPWSPSAEDFSKIVDKVLGLLAEGYDENLGKLPLRVADRPPFELICDGVDPRARVFLASLPTLTEEPDAIPPAPQRPRRVNSKNSKNSKKLAKPTTPAMFKQEIAGIVVYKRNLENVAASAEEIPRVLFASLVDEIFFFRDLEDDTLDTLLALGEQLDP